MRELRRLLRALDEEQRRVLGPVNGFAQEKARSAPPATPSSSTLAPDYCANLPEPPTHADSLLWVRSAAA